MHTSRGGIVDAAVMRSARVSGILFCAYLVCSCDGGGDGDPIDLVPEPENPFVLHIGLDTGDLNGDGLDDIAIAGRLRVPNGATTGHVDILLQDIASPGSFHAADRYATSSLPRWLTLADLNGDGNLDVIVSNRYSGNSIDVLMQHASGNGSLLAPVTFASIEEAHEIRIGDIDSDGFVDIVVAGENDVAWHRQRAGGDFEPAQIIGDGDSALVIADLDGDNRLEVVTHDGEPNGDLLVYSQFSGMTGLFGAPATLPTGESLDSIGSGDLNGDGLPDLYAAGFDIDNIADFFGVWFLMEQVSSNPLSFSRLPRLKTRSQFTSGPVVSADLDLDGDNDVVVGNNNGGSNRAGVEIYLNSGVGSNIPRDEVFTIPQGQEARANNMNAISIADLNNDSFPDIAVSTDEIFVLFQVTGSPGTFRAPIRVAGSAL